MGSYNPGGATTSKLHTSVKIAPEYDHPVVYVKDASLSAGVAARLCSGDAGFFASVQSEYAKLREINAGRRQKEYLSLQEARANRLRTDWSTLRICRPSFLGVRAFSNFPLQELRAAIDWTFFFLAWEMKGSYPKILSDPERGEEARKLLDEANHLLDEIVEHNLFTANGVVGLWPAHSAEIGRAHV